ncbi:MAG: hypothetical protein JWM74_5698 [Myxococcaceae bacterium]|nr:hypothetical protein [Myxococcaceae bacterium]
MKGKTFAELASAAAETKHMPALRRVVVALAAKLALEPKPAPLPALPWKDLHEAHHALDRLRIGFGDDRDHGIVRDVLQLIEEAPEEGGNEKGEPIGACSVCDRKFYEYEGYDFNDPTLAKEDRERPLCMACWREEQINDGKPPGDGAPLALLDKRGHVTRDGFDEARKALGRIGKLGETSEDRDTVLTVLEELGRAAGHL